MLVLASILFTSHTTETFFREVYRSLGRILPEGTSADVLQYFSARKPVKLKLLFTTSIFTLWTASGVMISWMEGFRKAYQMPKTWGLVQERMIAVFLVVLAGLPMAFAPILAAFGNQIERWTVTRRTTSWGHTSWGYGRLCDGLSLL